MQFLTNGNIHLKFSLDKGIHVMVWKIAMPIILLATLCACVLHWAGVI
jgi:hypothetical protein